MSLKVFVGSTDAAASVIDRLGSAGYRTEIETEAASKGGTTYRATSTGTIFRVFVPDGRGDQETEILLTSEIGTPPHDIDAMSRVLIECGLRPKKLSAYLLHQPNKAGRTGFYIATVSIAAGIALMSFSKWKFGDAKGIFAEPWAKLALGAIACGWVIGLVIVFRSTLVKKAPEISEPN